ncbi:MAG: 2-succinyl-6-hydroxy-2,4-cyclohexadiene-1-carboxylate synthase [Gemmatimonadota bacterium]|nr:2-succinyl-6-hydroxy-2,4-cyclohexadiene-1-carboxylate synthase [Gemmatimonadota bacterium]
MDVLLRDGLRLHARTGGAGPPVLLLHGFTGSAESWDDGLLRELGRAHRWIAVDLPGHGRSDRPGDPGRYALEAVVADLADLLDAAGAEAAAWIGYSMGGRIALGAAALAPARVRGLVLESASPGLATEEARAVRRREDAALAGRLRSDGIAAFVAEWEARPLFATQERLPPSVRAAQRRRRLANDASSLAACLGGLGTGSQPDFWDALPDIRAPTLVVAGCEDTKFADIGRRMAAALPVARLALVPGAGHAVHLEAPEAWLREVGSFLSTVGGTEAEA